MFSKDYDPEAPPFEGLKGTSLEIRSMKPGILAVCDVEIFAGVKDDSAAQAVKKCEDAQAQCDKVSSLEEKFNCQEYFGKPKTPEFCLA